MILWMLGGIIRFIWLIIVHFIFPKVRWLIALDVVYQGFRAIYFWNDPTMNAGWTFLLHFGVLTFFIYCHQFREVYTDYNKF